MDFGRQCIATARRRPLPPWSTRVCSTTCDRPEDGSCGPAALGQRVMMEDISTHPYWEGFAQLALPHGLRACWSTPILASDGRVLGTFAMYYLRPRGPNASEVEWVDAGDDLAAVAISRDRVERSVRRSEARYRQIIDAATEALDHRHVASDDLREPPDGRDSRRAFGDACRAARCSTSSTRMTVETGAEFFAANSRPEPRGQFRVRSTHGIERRVVSSVSPISGRARRGGGRAGICEGRHGTLAARLAA